MLFFTPRSPSPPQYYSDFEPMLLPSLMPRPLLPPADAFMPSPDSPPFIARMPRERIVCRAYSAFRDKDEAICRAIVCRHAMMSCRPLIFGGRVSMREA